MPLLKNLKHEMFAGLVAKGESARQAYITCGYSEHTCDAGASRLAKMPKIATRIVELRVKSAKTAVEKSALSKAVVLHELEFNARESRSAGDWKASNAAWIALGKEIGMFIDRSERKITFEDLPDEELRQMYSDAIREYGEDVVGESVN